MGAIIAYDGRLLQIAGSCDLSLVHMNADGELVEDIQRAVDAVEPGPLDDLLSEIRRMVAESYEQ